MCKNKKNTGWLEVIGLFLLLFAFGWQCLDEHNKQMRIEGFFYETNEKLMAIWEGVYDEALHSNRYYGKATVAINYDALHASIKDWSQVKDEMETLDNQASLFFWTRVVLYVVGSLLILAAKWPDSNRYGD